MLAAAASAKPTRPAGGGGPKDKAALRLDDEALGKDYLETNFIKAEKKLQQAIGMCAKGNCSPKVLARLHRDLAVVHLAGLGKVDAGKADLKTAVELDPDIELDPDYATPDLKKAFEQIKGVKAPPSKQETPKPAAQGISHTEVSEQAVATPVPVFARFGGAGSAKLKLWYKGVGAERWSSVDMELKGEGFAGEIPCSAAPKEGRISYFIEALGQNDETLAKDGSRTEPHSVAVRKELEGDAPHLPDEQPPARCKDVCVGDDCAAAKAAKRPRNNWIVVSVQQDFSIVGTAVDACAVGNQVEGSYSCFRASGSQYHGNPIAGDPGDSVNAGLAPATTRVLVGYDRVLVAGLVLGVRLGYVARGLGPRADGTGVHPPLPFHVEGRLAYWFGSEVFTTAVFRPFVFAAGGAAQVDTKFGVVVNEDPNVPPPPTQTDNPPQQALDAYRRMGQGFAGGGAGFMVAFTPAFGAVLDAKYMRLFPTGGNVLSPELGLAVGF